MKFWHTHRIACDVRTIDCFASELVIWLLIIGLALTAPVPFSGGSKGERTDWGKKVKNAHEALQNLLFFSILC